ncbi:unnamed protein product [Schistosoma turkestanicum]|nr:unnamed protein product [Schistosoma turkestanicum]
MVNFHYSNKDLLQTTTQFTSPNQHDYCLLSHDDNAKHLNDTIEWDLLKSIELNNEHIESNSNSFVKKQQQHNLLSLPNHANHQYKSPEIDNNHNNDNDTTTIESWTPSTTDQSFVINHHHHHHQKLLFDKMKTWKLYRNTSPLNYFHNVVNSTSNVDNFLSDKQHFIQCRYRTFEDLPKNQSDEHVATVHVFNRYLLNNEQCADTDQLGILTPNTYSSSPQINENVTEQFITPTIVSEEDMRKLDDCNQEFDHNARLNARHRIEEEYLQNLEKRYDVNMNQSNNNEALHSTHLTGYDLIPHSLLMSTSVDGLHAVMTTVQMDSSSIYRTVDQTILKPNTTEEKIIANKCEYCSCSQDDIDHFLQ